MVKIFLAEDEIVIRNGIKNSIDWEKEGYEFVGEAGDGEMAYPKIMKERPDILITDIRMPFMDGLELIRLVKKELPELKVLVLSGYSDFDYAKTALQLGVTDYLLKPVSSAKLLESLAVVSESIHRERAEQELKERYIKEMHENIEREKLKLFVRLVEGNIGMSEALECGEKLGIKFSAQVYRIMLFKAAMNAENYENAEEATEAFEKIDYIENTFPGVFSFWRGIEGWAFLISGETAADVEEKTGELKEKLSEIMAAYQRVEYFGGIGNTVERLRELSVSYHEASIVFASRFKMKSRQILSADELKKQQNEESFHVQSLGQMEQNRTLVEKFLVNGTIEEIGDFVITYFANIPRENLRSTLMRHYIIMDLFISVSSFYERLETEEEWKTEETRDMEETLQRECGEEGIKTYVEQLLLRAINRRDAQSGRRYSSLITQAKDYICQNYMQEISLNGVSAIVNMSPSYFSAVFSRETGETFVEFLTGMRMEKAKELLMCSGLKTSEIGYEVGYKDPHYFSYIFKKLQGCSPKEYRQRVKRGDENETNSAN